VKVCNRKENDLCIGRFSNLKERFEKILYLTPLLQEGVEKVSLF